RLLVEWAAEMQKASDEAASASNRAEQARMLELTFLYDPRQVTSGEQAADLYLASQDQVSESRILRSLAKIENRDLAEKSRRRIEVLSRDAADMLKKVWESARTAVSHDDLAAAFAMLDRGFGILADPRYAAAKAVHEQGHLPEAKEM